MGDRQDIDALLVGALYGELDSDDRTRLDAHLASHPGDRSALDGLRSTRAMLRSLRPAADASFGDAEPPAAISARLLQEAARRAPAPRVGEGLLGVFASLFRPLASLFRPIASHPALSAAAALVLVIGIGGLMMKNGQWKVAQPPSEVAGHDETLRERAADPATINGESSGERGVTSVAPNADVAGGAPGSAGFPVVLDDTATGALLDGEAAERKQGKLAAREAQLRTDVAKDAVAAKPTTKVPKATQATGFLEVDKHAAGGDLTMRDPDGEGIVADSIKGDSFRVGQGTSGPTGARPSDDSGDRDEAERAPSAGSGASRAPVAPPSIAPSPAPADPGAATAALKKEAENNAWARDQHARMVKLVNAGKCTEAGQIGAAINRKAPEYYQSAVANDRAVRSCQAYVDRARRAKAPAPAKSKAGNQQPDSRNDLEEAK